MCRSGRRNGKPYIDADLDQVNVDDAAVVINTWIRSNGIEVLDVAGTRAGKDPEIYKKALNPLEAVFSPGRTGKK